MEQIKQIRIEGNHRKKNSDFIAIAEWTKIYTNLKHGSNFINEEQ